MHKASVFPINGTESMGILADYFVENIWWLRGLITAILIDYSVTLLSAVLPYMVALRVDKCTSSSIMFPKHSVTLFFG